MALLLAGCVAGPDYVRPEVATPPAWKLEAPWRAGAPDDAAPKGPWWQRFGDARLDALQRQAIAQSPTLVARRRPAGAGARGRPRRLGRPGAERRTSPRARPGSTSPPTGRSPTTARRTSRRCRTTSCRCSSSATSSTSPAASSAPSKAREASADQSAADLENTRLLLGADLATAYFNLRAIDIELDVLARSIALQRRSLDFVSTRHDLGAASGLDVAQQQALLDTTLTQVDLLRRQRGLFEHAVATLTGTPAPSFELAPDIARARAADGAARRAVRRAAAPARRRLGRAGDGGGQRADRRRQRRVLSEHHDQPRARLRERAR